MRDALNELLQGILSGPIVEISFVVGMVSIGGILYTLSKTDDRGRPKNPLLGSLSIFSFALAATGFYVGQSTLQQRAMNDSSTGSPRTYGSPWCACWPPSPSSASDSSPPRTKTTIGPTTLRTSDEEAALPVPTRPNLLVEDLEGLLVKEPSLLRVIADSHHPHFSELRQRSNQVKHHATF